MGKLVALAQVGLLVSVLGSGCSLVPSGDSVPGSGRVPSGGAVPSGGPFACVDWVRFDTADDQYDKAGMVIIGKSLSRVGATTIYGHKATTHLVEVEQVLKGDPGDGNLRISSMPPTCTGGESYPDGDPLDPSQRVIIFATKQGGEWFTMTPAQGVLPFQQGALLPVHQRESSLCPMDSHQSL